MKRLMAAVLFVAATGVSAGSALAAPTPLTENQLSDESAGRRAAPSSPNRGGWSNTVFAPNISITNQIAIAIAINGTATAYNISITSQTNNIGLTYR